jgi:Flp pilus assembly protein TadD
MLASDDVRTLSDLGFIALFRGATDHAAAIFEAVQAARPGKEAGLIGTALVALMRGELDDATRILSSSRPTDAVQTFLAVALFRKGDIAEATDILSTVLRDTGDPACRSMAESVLNELSQRRSPFA